MANDMNEVFELTMADAAVITVPIDDTLSNSGEAADAKAVGDALALKADVSSVVAIDVNGQGADNQGHILIDGGDIPMGSSDPRTITAAVNAAAGRTGEDIPVSDDVGAMTIAQALETVGEKDATEIPMSDDESAPSIATKIAQTDATVSGLQQTVAGMNAKTGADIPLQPGSTKMIKGAIEERVLSVNSVTADANGDVRVDEVSFAGNLKSEQTRTRTEAFAQRTSGHDASIADGDAWLVSVEGNNVHTGYVAEVLNMSVVPVDPDDSPITATIDRAVFFAYVEGASGTITLSYTSSWSADPALYGVTVTGTPQSGDAIVISYTREQRGTITVAYPEEFVATGYNIFYKPGNYARVVRYSDTYGYMIAGDYSSLAFTEELGGETTPITVSGGQFNVPGTGFVMVTGGNATNTRIWPTWEDWTTAADAGDWEAYSETAIDLTDVLDEYFPNGLLSAGAVRDLIDLNIGYCVNNVDRQAYTEARRQAAEASGLAYEFDEDWIYIERTVPLTHSIQVEGAYTVSDHGIEFIRGEGVPRITTLYGNNLRNKLERDVLTISAQELTDAQKAQVQANIGISGGGSGADGILTVRTYSKSYTVASGDVASITLDMDSGQSAIPDGFEALCIYSYNSGLRYLYVTAINPTSTNGKPTMSVYNSSSSSQTRTASMTIFYIKSSCVS